MKYDVYFLNLDSCSIISILRIGFDVPHIINLCNYFIVRAVFVLSM